MRILARAANQAVLAAAWVLASAAGAAQQVVLIKNPSFLAPAIESTVVTPDGPGPFPVAVVNHGQSRTLLPSQHPRYAPEAVVRAFVERNYAVVLPMRRGFSNSGGRPVGFGGTCSLFQFGEQAAQDLDVVVRWLGTQPWADTQRMVMVGQSAGGLATLAYAASSAHPGFKLFLSFSGGVVDTTSVCNSQQALEAVMRAYGTRTRTPSLWFYGASDSFFPPAVYRSVFAAYVAGGAPAELVEVGGGGSGADSHRLFTLEEGVALWLPPVLKAMGANGLPTGAGGR